MITTITKVSREDLAMYLHIRSKIVCIQQNEEFLREKFGI